MQFLHILNSWWGSVSEVNVVLWWFPLHTKYTHTGVYFVCIYIYIYSNCCSQPVHSLRFSGRNQPAVPTSCLKTKCKLVFAVRACLSNASLVCLRVLWIHCQRFIYIHQGFLYILAGFIFKCFNILSLIPCYFFSF